MPESSLMQNLNIDDEEAFGDEELIDIKNRVNVLRDVSIDMNNMNTDDQQDDLESLNNNNIFISPHKQRTLTQAVIESQLRQNGSKNR